LVLINFIITSSVVDATALIFFIFIFGADVSTTMILKPGPVIDFLLANQNVRDPRYIDWLKVKIC
jgi:hypothetical protein